MSWVFPLCGKGFVFLQSKEPVKLKEYQMSSNLAVHLVVCLFLICKRLEFQQHLDMSQYKSFVCSTWKKELVVKSLIILLSQVATGGKEFGDDKSNDGGRL